MPQLNIAIAARQSIISPLTCIIIEFCMHIGDSISQLIHFPFRFVDYSLLICILSRGTTKPQHANFPYVSESVDDSNWVFYLRLRVFSPWFFEALTVYLRYSEWYHFRKLREEIQLSTQHLPKSTMRVMAKRLRCHYVCCCKQSMSWAHF